MSPPVLLVFSHLRWAFVHQRPQHLLSRLAAHWQVLYVEEPVHCAGPGWLEERQPCAGVTVLVPHTPQKTTGFDDEQQTWVHLLLFGWLQDQPLDVDVAWLYTPLALPLAQASLASCIVYDCMDELTGFKNAPPQLRQREQALMEVAGLVLTGGPSLYRARSALHPNVHCLPSAVDAAHYSPCSLEAGNPHALQADSLQAHLPHPRLGYFGVIDERLDIELLAHLADAHPEWAIVMVGPVVKIDPASLPRRNNIHWLGMQPYALLPYLLAGWDLCLMPFALNDATRFISPTKTLEYMAGDKPVVSTAVCDVVTLFGSAVEVVRGDRDDFVTACEGVLAEDAAARYVRAQKMLQAVSAYSWDRSAAAVHRLLLKALAQAKDSSAESPMVTAATPAFRRASPVAAPGTRLGT